MPLIVRQPISAVCLPIAGRGLWFDAQDSAFSGRMKRQGMHPSWFQARVASVVGKSLRLGPAQVSNVRLPSLVYEECEVEFTSRLRLTVAKELIEN